VLQAGVTGNRGRYSAQVLFEKEYKPKIIIRNLNKVSFDVEKYLY